MKPASCVACSRPVLELEGQFEKLDSHYVGNGGPSADSAGWWHRPCLSASSVGAVWSQARLRNYLDVRGARVVDQIPHWTVVELPHDRQRLAIGDTGQLVALPADRHDWRPVHGAMLRPIAESMFTLEADPTVIAEIQRGLLSPAASFPLMEVMNGLGIADRIADPIALEGGVFRFAPEFREYWTHDAITARAEYAVLIPGELL